MRRRAFMLVALLLTLVSGQAAQGAEAIATGVGAYPINQQIAELRSRLPVGNVTVDLMELAAPPRLLVLATQLQAAVSRDPAWFQQHVMNTPPGEPLPYDPRMGISAEEYAEFLQLADTIVMQPVGQAPLEFLWLSESRLRLKGGAQLSELTDLEIDFESNTVKTRAGTLSSWRRINNTDPESPTGPWTGVEWTLEQVAPDLSSGVVIKFALGRLESGRGILRYEETILEGGRSSNVERILYFTLREP